MPISIIEVTCPHCAGPLVVQRAAPADPQLRIACPRCGAEARVGVRVMEPVVMGPDPREALAA